MKNKFHLAVIELTDKCNLACKHCYGYFEKNDFCSFDDFKLICNQLRQIDVSMVTLSGGEPLLLKDDIKRYIAYAKKKFKIVNLTTNGTLIDENNARNLSMVDCVQVSIDGPQKVHDKIRGKGNYLKAVNAVKQLKKVTKCTIMMTVSDFNQSYFTETIKIAKKLKVEMGFERITNVGRGSAFLNLKLSNFARIVGLAEKYNIESSDPLCAVSNETKKKYLIKNKIFCGCLAGIMAIAVDCKLNVFPCVRLRKSVGNLKRKNLTEIIQNSRVIKNLNDRNRLKGICGKCSYKYICGGCRGAAFSVSCDYLGEDPGCFLFKSM